MSTVSPERVAELKALVKQVRDREQGIEPVKPVWHHRSRPSMNCRNCQH